jgi:hypothetical protein
MTKIPNNQPAPPSDLDHLVIPSEAEAEAERARFAAYAEGQTGFVKAVQKLARNTFKTLPKGAPQMPPVASRSTAPNLTAPIAAATVFVKEPYTPAERRTLGILFAALVIFAAGLTIGILWARSPDQPKLLTSASAATTTTGSATSAPLPTATEASATAGPKTTASPSAEPSQSPTVARTAEPSSKAIAPETSASSQVSAQPKPSAQPTTSGNGIWMMNQGQKR